jgi:hypothetical protein
MNGHKRLLRIGLYLVLLLSIHACKGDAPASSNWDDLRWDIGAWASE